uniref:Ras-like protein n=1 Tax=Neobodo designis TaxID=312471 RepID=A0A7S1M3T9_NEODS|mmetsp:Transcript_33371/g.103051  ORF Transcript_33371/g.103051 Transcript_33371/m.103051 type:complete len:223 (+) Transcript_33371:46-714(+)
MPEINIVVLGAGAVGKSCVTIQFIQGHFVDCYDATIEDVYRKPVEVDGCNYVLTIVDTAGQDAFATTREAFMKDGQAFVLVYSITDSESFQQLKRQYTQLRRTRGDDAQSACIVVGNKADLGGQRAVAPDEGEVFARQVNCPFKEVSAKNRLEIEDVFTTLVRSFVRGGSTAPPGSVPVPANTATSRENHGATSTTPAKPAPQPVAPKPPPRRRFPPDCVSV